MWRRGGLVGGLEGWVRGRLEVYREKVVCMRE